MTNRSSSHRWVYFFIQNGFAANASILSYFKGSWGADPAVIPNPLVSKAFRPAGTSGGLLWETRSTFTKLRGTSWDSFGSVLRPTPHVLMQKILRSKYMPVTHQRSGPASTV